MQANDLATIQAAVQVKREEGYNCAEGVFWGVSQVYKLDVPSSCVTGFGGGVAGTGSVCGALCGAIAAISVYVGRTNPNDIERKNKAMALSRQINDGFVRVMESQLCHEILGHLPGSQPKKPGEGINPQCVKAVASALELAVQAIANE